MLCAIKPDAEAQAELYQPIRGTEPLCLHVCADTLVDDDSGSDVAPTELEVSSDEDEPRPLKLMCHSTEASEDSQDHGGDDEDDGG